MFEIEVLTKKDFKNPQNEHILSDIASMGIASIAKVRYSPLYFICGKIRFSDVKIIASELLIDKITESYVIRRCSDLDVKDVNLKMNSSASIIEVWYKKGITDTVAESVVKAVKDLNINVEVKIKVGHKYYLYSKESQTTLNNNPIKSVIELIATKLLANTLVQDCKIR
ncbi:MAG: phosphoribosylformylglycinamidine synthase subunit PurS [Endomicrobium sp.]|jgi:phosphoribosylformylglycinamidine synthase|nr:phosphoribosylformylglycinamidine synthase subunit PurS [Endomicrobium sp.]